jgi:hypothetical protein
MCFLLKKIESSLLKSFGPTFFPKAYPTVSPTIEATNVPMRSPANEMWPCEAKNPAVKRSESPGKKKPKKRPVSAKMMRITPISPRVEIISVGLMRL